MIVYVLEVGAIGYSELPLLTGWKLILSKGNVWRYLSILPKCHVKWETAAFQGLGKGRIFWRPTAELKFLGHLWEMWLWTIGLWHFQHRVSCWTAGLLFSFLVSSQPHNLSRLHTPQRLWFRPAKIVGSCCQVESGFCMSWPQRCTVSVYEAPTFRLLEQVGAEEHSDPVLRFRWILLKQPAC